MSVFRLRWSSVCYFFPWCCGVDSSPMSPSLLYLKPLRNINTFPHVIYKSKKKTNLLCILNNVFQYSKIRTRKRNAKKSIKQKKIGIQPFLESGIHRVESRIQDCRGFPFMGRVSHRYAGIKDFITVLNNMTLNLNRQNNRNIVI